MLYLDSISPTYHNRVMGSIDIEKHFDCPSVRLVRHTVSEEDFINVRIYSLLLLHPSKPKSLNKRGPRD